MRGFSYQALALMAALTGLAAGAAPGAPSVAMRKPYTVDPAPNYALCTDSGDASQLTDGFETNQNFWTEKTTVGWQGRSPVTVTVDLGRITSIRGASFRTAAGKAGVEWPAAIHVFASDDGKTFAPLGDLVELSDSRKAAAPAGYRIFTYSSDALHGHGRYVRFVVEASGPFIFSDEIGVFEGPPEWVGEAPSGIVADTTAYFEQSLTQRRVVAALRRDLKLAQGRVEKSTAPAATKSAWATALAALQRRIDGLAPVDPEKFRAVLPMDPIHAAIFAVIGEVEAAAGAAPLSLWRANAWDFLTPVDGPPSKPSPASALSLLRGEVRPFAVNLRNATGSSVTAILTLKKLPPGATIDASEVAWTETQSGTPVAAALLKVAARDDGFEIDVPAGMTRQVWLRLRAGDSDSGSYAATLSVGDAALAVPIQVVSVRFPEKPRLHMGGWDYTNTDTLYGLTPENVMPLIEHLRSRHVDSPWATSAVLPFGTFDGSGRMIQPPVTSNFDRWIERWPDARRYMVFLDAQEAVGGIDASSTSFAPAIAAWLGFWVDHARKRGVGPERIHLLLVDEPREASATAKMLPWARAIRRAATGVRIWEDPTFTPPPVAPPEFVEAVDAICLNRTLGASVGESYWNAAVALRGLGKQLELYDASGPTRTMDPYTYYRLQAWQAFAIGAKGSSFWAFADDGDASSWNELAGTRKAFTPLFLDSRSVTPGKHLEAWVESAHDYEVLSLLAEAIEAKPGEAGSTRARIFLQKAVATVLGAPGAGDFGWASRKPREAADEVRAEAAQLLEGLGGGPAD